MTGFLVAAYLLVAFFGVIILLDGLGRPLWPVEPSRRNWSSWTLGSTELAP